MLSKDILTYASDDQLTQMFLDYYKGFNLNLEYDSDVEEYILGLVPITNGDCNADVQETVYHFNKLNMENPDYTSALAIDCFTDGEYVDNKGVNSVIQSMVTLMEDRIRHYIKGLLILSNNKCPYCSIETKGLPKDSQRIDGVHIIDNNIVIETSNQDIDEYNTINVHINYCPMCGRKLTKEGD